MADTMLIIKNLTKIYDDGTEALKDVSFEVEPGEFLVVIGLSGSGKSTLLRCINRLIEPTEGQILWDGVDIVAAEPDQLRRIRRQIGMIFQHFNLVNRSSVLSNVLAGRLGYVSPWSSLLMRFPREDREKAAKAQERVGIADQAAKRASELSGGPPAPVEEAGRPYLVSTPTCGNLTRRDDQYRDIMGTTLSLAGRGFSPDTEIEIWWVDPIGNDFQMRQKGEYVSVRTGAGGAFTIDVIMPYRLMPPSLKGRQFHRIEARQISFTGVLKIGDPLRLTVERMVETIFMGMMATIFGIILSIPVSFLAARNLMSGSVLTMGIYHFTRTILNIIRPIELLIWALIAVVWVGLGPFAGIIALTIHSVAALGKLYSEAIENIDPGPVEAIQATGANRLQTIMFAVVPQMISPFVSFSIYRWDINVRMSTVIGLVGGGGIGFLLVQYIRLLDYRAAGIAVWFIAVTVGVLDYVSAEIRQRFR